MLNINVEKIIENKKQFLRGLKEKYNDVVDIKDYIEDLDMSIDNLKSEYELRKENEELKYNKRRIEQLKELEDDIIETIERLIMESLNNMF